MKSTRRSPRAARLKEWVDVSAYLPVPDHTLHSTGKKERGEKGKDSGSGPAASGLEKKLAAMIDKESEAFYGALCEMYEKLDVHPAVALHSMTLFIQSLKRFERNRLGISDPETP